MRKQMMGVGIAALMFVGSANAALITQTDGTIFDDDSGKYWTQVGLWTGMTYQQQIDGIDEYGNDSHMATLAEMRTLWTYEASEINQHFVPTDNTWTLGRFDSGYLTTHQHAYVGGTQDTGYVKSNLNGGYCSDDWISPAVGAWVVTSPNAPVPEPSTLLIVGTGLAGLVGSRIRKKKD